MLKILDVSRSGYYDFLDREPSNQALQKETKKTKIKTIYEESKQIYGAPKIKEKLQNEGINIAVKTVSNYMRELDIRAIYRSKWVKTTVSGEFSETLTNHLNREFNPTSPNSVWVSDITYVWTYEGFVYLTSVMDLFSRKIIAWTLSRDLTVSAVVDCVEKAIRRRVLDLPLVIHSDRGVQYISAEYKKLFNKNMKRSYSKKGDPWDNACIESFHALIKREWLKRFKIKNYEHAYQLIFEYIETFYNTVRIHGSLNYLTPNSYEQLFEQTKTDELNII